MYLNNLPASLTDKLVMSSDGVQDVIAVMSLPIIPNNLHFSSDI